MSTAFDRLRRRERDTEVALADYPVWALEIMRGLYGPRTIDTALNQHRRLRTFWRYVRGEAPGGVDSPARPAAERGDAASSDNPPTPVDDPVPPLSPLVAELEGMEMLGNLVLRLFHRRR